MLGLPLGDAWTDGAITRQSFRAGRSVLGERRARHQHHDQPDEIDLSGCVAALGTVKARLKPRGTSDIVLFTFATGPEGLKTNPVTGKVGDVSKLSSVDWAPNEGDPSPGADQLTIGFSDLSQSANFFIEEKSGTRDLTGTTLFVRVKVTQGFSPSPSVPGGLVFLVYNQAFKNCYSKYNNVEQGGVWREYTFDLRECAPGPSAPDSDEGRGVWASIRHQRGRNDCEADGGSCPHRHVRVPRRALTRVARDDCQTTSGPAPLTTLEMAPSLVH